MRRFPQRKRLKNFQHLLLPGRNTSLNLDPVFQSKRRIDGVNLNLQEEITKADINYDLGAVHTPGLRDPHHIRRDPGDHAQRIGNHHTEGKSLHLTLQMEGQA